MKVVLDTNVLVSGLLSPSRPPADIVRMTSAGTLQLCYDARILTEYKNILSRPKFGLELAHIEALLDQIKACGYSVAAKPLPKSLPDKEDEPFLEVAIAGQAQCLITGNLKHYPAACRQGIEIFSPADFLEFYRRKQARIS
jgi:putative PIN family toxin of toxin-antitoxin system